MNVLYRIVRRNAKNANGEVYARVVMNSLITADDLVDLIARDSQVERAQVAVVTDAIGKQIKELVMNGHNIKVGSLGTLGIGFRTKWSDSPLKVNINECLRSVRVRFITSEEIRNLQRSCRKSKTVIRNKTEN
ncbi:MAG: HU family DNA-binding protein [Prevotella sp.]|nr:HU family DNA-binding protein [Prevotella sp.]